MNTSKGLGQEPKDAPGGEHDSIQNPPSGHKNIETELLNIGLKAIEEALNKPKTWQETPEWTGPRLYKDREEFEQDEENFGVGA